VLSFINARIAMPIKSEIEGGGAREGKRANESVSGNERRVGRCATWLYQHISKISPPQAAVRNSLVWPPTDPSAIITIRYDYAIIITAERSCRGWE
jgi:hypothetical protein